MRWGDGGGWQWEDRAWAFGVFSRCRSTGFEVGSGGFREGFRPRGSRPGQRGGEVAEQRHLGTGCGEGEADARRGLDDAGADFEGLQAVTAPGFSDTRRRYAASWVATAAAIHRRLVLAGRGSPFLANRQCWL